MTINERVGWLGQYGSCGPQAYVQLDLEMALLLVGFNPLPSATVPVWANG